MRVVVVVLALVVSACPTGPTGPADAADPADGDGGESDDEPLVVTLGADAVIVLGEDVTLTASVSGGTAPLSCQWLRGDEVVGTACDAATVAPVATTAFLFVVDDAAGRREAGTALVTVADALSVQVASTAVAPGASITLRAEVAGGVPPLSCAWRIDGGALPGDCEGVTFAPTATATVDLVVEDSGGRSVATSATVEVATPLVVVAPADQDVLIGQTTTLTPSISGGLPPIACTWRVDDVVVASSCDPLEVTVSETGAYVIVVEDAVGQRAIGAAALRAFPGLEVGVSPAVSQVLAGGSVRLSTSLAGGVPPLSCVWSGPGGVLQASCGDLDIAPAEATMLTLVVTDANGNTESATGEVRVLSLGTMLTPASDIIEGMPITVTAVLAGLIGPAACTWHDAGGVAVGAGCELTLPAPAPLALTVVASDTTTGNALSAELSAPVVLGVCDDGFLNGAEDDVDCGAPATPGWINEIALAAQGDQGAVLVEAVFDGITAGFTLYKVDNGALVVHESTPPIDAITCGTAPGFVACQLSYSGAQAAALAYTDSSEQLVDFLAFGSTAPFAAVDGPAAGRFPRPTADPILNDDTLDPNVVSLCAVGAGDRAIAFEWRNDCLLNLLELNPGQTLTGLYAGCAPCSAGQTCVSAAGCASAVCDDGVCGP